MSNHNGQVDALHGVKLCMPALFGRAWRTWFRKPSALTSMIVCAVVLCGCERQEPAQDEERPSPPAAVQEQRPNILLITLDTTRADRLGCYGYEQAQTPVMDELATTGVRYQFCYATTPLTLPSHASIMTGVYPLRHHLRVNTGALSDDFDCLAERLKEQNYQTGAVIGVRMLAKKRNLHQGFDYYDDDFRESSFKSTAHMLQRRADVVSRLATQWLDNQTEGPWFLWVHYFDPHAEYDAPGTPPGTDDDQAYDLEIAYVDKHLNSVLESAQASSRTHGHPLAIVLTADHGESLGAHGESTHGFFAYNETVQVPLIVKPPDGKPANTTVSQVVSIVDIYPTILNWAGLTPNYKVDGALLPFQNTKDARLQRRPVYFESYGPMAWYEWSPLGGVVSIHWKYIEAPRPELYDLSNDPAELKNLYRINARHAVALEDALSVIGNADTGPNQAPPTDHPSSDAEETEMLAALGYVGVTTQGTGPREQAIDPKDMIDVHTDFLDARAYAAGGSLDLALEILERSLMRDATNPTILTELTKLLDRPKGTERIAAIIQRAVSELPPTPRATFPYTVLGVAQARTGDLGEAETWFKKALAIDEHYGEAHYNLGEVLLLRGSPPLEAEVHLRAAFESDPANEQFADGLVRLYQRTNQLDRAVEAYERLIELDESNARAHYKMAVLYCRIGRYNACAEHVKLSLSLMDAVDSDEPEAKWILQAQSLMQQLQVGRWPVGP